MDHPEGFGSASASEVPTCPPGPGYNFRPRSRSATAPKNRRLGPVELQGVGSTLDLPAITPPTSPTPSGAGIPPHEINTELISHDLTTESSPPFSQLMPNPIAAGVSTDNSTLIPNTVGNSPPFSTLVTHNSTATSKLANSTLYYFTASQRCSDLGFCQPSFLHFQRCL